MKRFKITLHLIAVGLALSTFVATVQATPTTAGYRFYGITHNDPTGAARSLGESAFYVDVSSVPGFDQQVLFTFGVLEGFDDPYDSYYIDGVYFYDGSLLEIASLIDADTGGDAGVSFTEAATPGHLPGFDPADYPMLVYGVLVASADADSPPGKNGISAGEELGVLFDLRDGKTYGDVIAGLNTGAVIVGVKAQGFGEYSESFITIPAPGAILIGGIGVALVGWLRRRRNL